MTGDDGGVVSLVSSSSCVFCLLRCSNTFLGGGLCVDFAPIHQMINITVSYWLMSFHRNFISLLFTSHRSSSLHYYYTTALFTSHLCPLLLSVAI